MATAGFKDVHFICDITMEEEIHATHQVKIKIPGLILDLDGVVVEEATFTFNPAGWDTPQELGVLGEVEGRYPASVEITSPFYVSHGQLKRKKDEFTIIIDATPTEGWTGSIHGETFGSGMVGSWSAGNLQYVHTILPEDSYPQSIVIKYPSGSALIGVVMTGAGSADDFDSTGAGCEFTMPSPGTYVFNVYSSGIYGVNSVYGSTLGNLSVEAIVDGGSPVPNTVQRRGVIYRFSMEQSFPGFDVPFSFDFGTELDSFMPAVTYSFVSYQNGSYPPRPVPPAPSLYPNFQGNVTWNGTNATCSGQWKFETSPTIMGISCTIEPSVTPAGSTLSNIVVTFAPG